MKPSDLSPVMLEAYNALPEELRESFLKEQEAVHGQALRGAIAQIQARNNSHNMGEHVRKIKIPKGANG